MRSILLFQFIILLFSCNQPPTKTETFTMAESMYIPVTINGQKHDFLFDTGAEISVISPLFAESLGTELVEEDIDLKVSVIDGHRHLKYVAKFTEPTKLTICGTTIKTTLLCADMQKSHRKKGIIGQDVIKQLYWLFDISKQQFCVSNKPILDSIRQDQDLVLPYRSESILSHMVVDLSINDSDPMKYIFDTGCAIRVLFEEPLFVDIIFSKNFADLQPEEIHRRLNANSIIHKKISRQIPPFDNKFQFMDSVKVNARGNMTLFCATSLKTSSNLIGLGFIQYFDKMYIDPFKQEIVLIKCRQDKNSKSMKIREQNKRSDSTSHKTIDKHPQQHVQN